MKNSILIGLLCFYTISIKMYAQSVSKNTVNKGLLSEQSDSEEKRNLSPEDYKLWERLYNNSISDNGAWYTYSVNKPHTRENTVFLGSTINETKYNFPNGVIVQFSKGSKWFGCLNRGGILEVLGLEKGTEQKFTKVSKFEFSSDGNYLMVFKKATSPSEPSDLIIINLKSKKQDIIVGVRDYLMNPNSNDFTFILDMETEKAVKLGALGGTTSTIIAQNRQYPYKNLVWNTEGTALAFLQEQRGAIEKQNTYKVYCYKTIKEKTKLHTLDPAEEEAVFSGKLILNNRFKLKFAPKGLALYFQVHDPIDLEKSKVLENPDDIEVWKARDKELYPERKENQLYKKSNYFARSAIWYPDEGKSLVLETNALPNAIITVDGKYMLSYNPLAYAPHYKQHGDIDIYLTNLETGTTSLFLKKYVGRNIQMSPGGNYISYFLDKHWWVYDLEQKTHTNITKNLRVPLHNLNNHHDRDLPPYGSPGWTAGDKELLVYDRYDVWLVTTTGKAQRLTEGRASQIRHRIYKLSNEIRGGELKKWFSKYVKRVFDLSEGLIFETAGSDMKSGFSLWKSGKQLKTLVYKDMKVNHLHMTRNKEAYTYTEQSFSLSPRIMYSEKNISAPRLLKASNLHQNQFHWGHSELIHYIDTKGEALQGALFYPANYKPEKKYPMVVNIYEIMSRYLHYYVNPSLSSNKSRLNWTNYTSNGYFVFLPDIKYKLNDPGISAVRCVEAGVKAVLTKGNVEANHIGLIGVSFGGYETSFIISQSNLFAAAVAGAGVTNLVCKYHTYGAFGSEIWRVEDQQYRFKGSFYQNPEAYIRNSPLHHAADINTPLLLWHGKEDKNVIANQSIALYLGLRRLDKTCELILYPGEAHGVSKPKNVIDIGKRIKSWFDSYLKPEAKIDKKLSDN